MRQIFVILLFCLSIILGESNIHGDFFAVVGTRAVGLSAYTAVANDSTATFWNPAGLVRIKEKEISFMQIKPFSINNIVNNYLSYAQFDEGKGAFGLSWLQLKFNFYPIEETWTNTVYIGSYGKQLHRNFIVGSNIKMYKVDANLKYSVSNRSTDSKASGFGIDLSLLSPITEKFSIGLLGQDLYSSINWKTGLKEKASPINIKIGSALIDDNILFALDCNLAEDEILKNISFGTEYWLKNLSKKSLIKKTGIRAGITKEFFGQEALTISAGLSLRLEKIQIDYAALFLNKDLGNMHRFSISLFMK